ncbi:MAG: exodeoxyribonuclease VII large subunit [Parcubacteria group bacterium]|nr:exodeoxyribonuclease VII large subunit [Parcubacteria group bacterium]|tara:strand:+ start:111 stop:1370 length:1260 start_codon:yes stop_codon:yes gene_type:complete
MTLQNMQIIGVTEFLSIANQVIAPMRDLAVEGEVSGFSVRQNKWVFFSVKDDESVMECFSMVFKINIPIEDGMKVRIHGYPSVYKKSGRFRFMVDRVEPVGEGALKKAYEALKKKLDQEGLFASERKRELPEFPSKVGFIGSDASAAFSDFVRIMNNRWSGSEIQVHDVRVQGDGAPGDIVKAFKFFNKLKSKHPEEAPQVLVLTRGGGSLEDLWAFNDEKVARAVFSSSIPVVCGVGHEKDESLADYVADVRASTPSNAAEIIVPEKRDVEDRIDASIGYVESEIDAAIMHHKHNINTSLHTLEKVIMKVLHEVRQIFQSFKMSLSTIERLRQEKLTQLKHHTNRLIEKISDGIILKQKALEGNEKILTQVNPSHILKRGYSITRDKKGAVVKDAKQLTSGDPIIIQFAKGTSKAITK